MEDNNMPEEDLPFQFRDWAYLPPVVVELISKKVKSITDYVRFRAVCSTWRSASLPNSSHLPPQLPWLMLPFEPRPNQTDPDEKDNGIRLLYDLWEGKMRRLYLPETIDMMCCASYHGWLLLVSVKGREVFLLNPLTRDRIQLPSFTSPVKLLGNDSDSPRFDATTYFESHHGCFGKSTMTFSVDITDPNCMITVFIRPYRVICCRVGDSCWTRVLSRRNRYLIDATYYNGQFYLLYGEAMDIIKSNNPEERIVFNFEPELKYVRMHFLDGKSGIYMIAFHPDGNVEVYQFQEQPLKLKVTGTSDTIIFSGCIIRPHLAICSDDWDSLDGDSIYMENNGLFNVEESRRPHYSIFAFDRDANEIEHIVRNPGKKQLCWPPEPALWFQQSFM
ncbi:F-box family protein [Rhynchospora pubera]|uniref:F-box family protein n=1 Tax=Rhynchospora pubera TaxID=906938 RepID=A0AAV8DX24_9POAL|nr:F-box family protein [Rhynchospora pubera]